MNEKELEQINQYAISPLTAEDVFTFEVKLCDNEIDRDGERFSREAIDKLAELFIGRTGIFDHNPRGENQNARIYATGVVEEPERTTSAGEIYTYLKAKAYMVRTDANEALIREIDGGIKKEVSISCSVARKTCSICGANRTHGSCTHMVGKYYQNKCCHTILEDVTDAYEWSFVAIPAQREAGVTKQYGTASDRINALTKQVASQSQMLEMARAAIREEIVRLRFLNNGVMESDALDKAMEHLDIDELIALEKVLRKNAQGEIVAQLTNRGDMSENDDFRI